MTKPMFFLSYSRADSSVAEYLRTTLQAAGYAVDGAVLHIEPGRDLVSVLSAAGGQNRQVLVLVSRDFVGTSGYSRSSWIASTLSRSVPIIPLIIDDVDPEAYLGSFETIRFHRDRPHKDVIDRLLRAVGETGPTPTWASVTELLAGSQQLSTSAATGLMSLWNVPIEPGIPVSGRDDLLRTMHSDWLSTTLITHVLSGLPGVGKSSLASAYAHRYRSDYDVIWWVRGFSKSSVNEDISRLGEKLGVWTPHRDSWTEASSKVRDWLESAGRRWLLVFDNVTDPGTVADWLPRRGAGHVVMTSPTADPWPTQQREIFLDAMDEEKAIEFLLARSGSTDDAGARRLIAGLGTNTAVLRQAAAYVLTLGVSFDIYARLLHKWIPPHFSLLDVVSEESSRHLIEATCRVAVEAATDGDDTCADILDALAFLEEPAPIPQWCLEELRPRLRERPDILQKLCRLALIDFTADQHIVLHPIFPKLYRQRMSAPKQADVSNQILNWLDKRVPSRPEELATWAVCSALEPHAMSLLSQVHEAESAETHIDLMHRLGRYRFARGDTRTGLRLLQAALDAHPESAQGGLRWDALLNDMAVMLAEDGKWAEAVSITTDLLRRSYTDANTGNAQVVVLMSNVAAAFADSGRLLDSVSIYERIVNRRGLGIHDAPVAEDRFLFTAQHNLATVLDELRRLPEAERLLRAVHRARLVLLGRDHPDTMSTTIALASVLAKLEQFEEATALIQESLLSTSVILGDYHRTTVAALDAFAHVSLRSGASSRALVAAQQALARRRDLYGEEDNRTVDSLFNLGLVAQELGQTQICVDIYERVVDLRQRLLGPQHPKTMIAVTRLADCRPTVEPAQMRDLIHSAVPDNSDTATVFPHHPVLADDGLEDWSAS